MARRKNLPEAVQTKASLSEQLRAIRAELFGERGGPELARRLGIPIRTWYNYESGVTVPAQGALRCGEQAGRARRAGARAACCACVGCSARWAARSCCRAPRAPAPVPRRW